jgi:hypothetical protein
VSTLTPRLKTAEKIIKTFGKSAKAAPDKISLKASDLTLSVIVISAIKSALESRVRNLPPITDILTRPIGSIWMGANSHVNFRRFLMAIETSIKNEVPKKQQIAINASVKSKYQPSLKVNELYLMTMAEFK